MLSELSNCGTGIFEALFAVVVVMLGAPLVVGIIGGIAGVIDDFRRKRKGLPSRAEEAAEQQRLAEAQAEEQEKEDALNRVLEDPELAQRAKERLEGKDPSEKPPK